MREPPTPCNIRAITSELSETTQALNKDPKINVQTARRNKVQYCRIYQQTTHLRESTEQRLVNS